MRIKVRVTLDDQMLGTNPGNDDMFEEWIKGKRDENEYSSRSGGGTSD